MPKTLIGSVPARFYAAGTYTPGPTAVPPDATQVFASFTRSSWPLDNLTPVLGIRIELSYDGGATWPDFAAGEWGGGVRLNKAGAVVTKEEISRSLGQVGSTTRRVRAVATVMAGLTTAIEFSIS